MNLHAVLPAAGRGKDALPDKAGRSKVFRWVSGEPSRGKRCTVRLTKGEYRRAYSGLAAASLPSVCLTKLVRTIQVLGDQRHEVQRRRNRRLRCVEFKLRQHSLFALSRRGGSAGTRSMAPGRLIEARKKSGKRTTTPSNWRRSAADIARVSQTPERWLRPRSRRAGWPPVRTK